MLLKFIEYKLSYVEDSAWDWKSFWTHCPKQIETWDMDFLFGTVLKLI